jgi:tripartite-type tricarboxylate transporter receptor subunit TctC
MDITLVSYRGGAAALNDLLGGQVTGMIASMGLVLPHVQSGKIVAIGVSSPTRSTQVPNVPTIASVIPGFEAQSWTGMVAPAGTPKPIVDRLNAELQKALLVPAVKTRLEDMGGEVRGSTSEEMRNMVATQTQKWIQVVNDAKIPKN